MTTLTTSLEIAKLALAHCGVSKAITAIDADASVEDRMCNLFYAPTRDELLELYPWSHAIEHRPLVLTAGYYEYNQEFTYTAPTISAITKADPASVTCTSHGYSTGDYVKIYDVSGMTEVNRTDPYHITVSDVNTFTLTGIDSTNWTAYTSSGSAVKLEPLSTYQNGFVYDLPSNYAYGVRLDGDYDWELKGIGGALKLLCTIEDAVLVYVKNDTTDVSKWRATFVSLLSIALAIKIAPTQLGIEAAETYIRKTLNPMYTVAENAAMLLQARDKGKTRDTTEPWITARAGV